MLAGTKRISTYRIPAREIAYSVVEEEAGLHCGIVQDIHFNIPIPNQSENMIRRSPLACKMRIFLWAGIERHKSACFEKLPPGFEAEKTEDNASFCRINTKYSTVGI